MPILPERDVVIRPLMAGDLTAVAGIYAHYVTASVATFDEAVPSVADWEAKLAGIRERGLPFLVADDGGEVLGFAYASPWRPKPAYRNTAEDTIYLAPGGTGRGLGRRLLADLLDGCREAGVRTVIAVIADSGTPRRPPCTGAPGSGRRGGSREWGSSTAGGSTPY